MLNNSTKSLKIFCDGGARGNPGPAAIGFAVFDQKHQLIFKFSQYIGKRTNNFAEYQAVIVALEWLKKNQDHLLSDKIEFRLDSSLVINQLSGKFKIKDPLLKQQFIKVKNLETNFQVDFSSQGLPLFDPKQSRKISYLYVPREENKIADLLVNEALNTHWK